MVCRGGIEKITVSAFKLTSVSALNEGDRVYSVPNAKRYLGQFLRHESGCIVVECDGQEEFYPVTPQYVVFVSQEASST